jgi:lipopolysaccharide/colanic/teichoic acid biosynthesis glycosyltransferase
MTGRRDGFARRIFDITVSVIGILLLLPLIGGVALLVWWRLGSPVLFRQRRSGRGGKEFEILKFRTMHPPCWVGQPDRDRETRLGVFLRRTSLDEIPQMLNVLRGEMSLIGPRPTLPDQVREYDQRQRGRLAVRPGITGWAQVHGRNLLSWTDRIELDLWYIEHRSWWLDARILALTVVALVHPCGITGPGGVNPGFPASGGSAS